MPLVYLLLQLVIQTKMQDGALYVQTLLPGGAAEKSRSLMIGTPRLHHYHILFEHFLRLISAITRVDSHSFKSGRCSTHRPHLLRALAISTGDVLLQVDGVDVTSKPASRICVSRT